MPQGLDTLSWCLEGGCPMNESENKTPCARVLARNKRKTSCPAEFRQSNACSVGRFHDLDDAIKRRCRRW